MQPLSPDSSPLSPSTAHPVSQGAVIEITVNNHPGVMSHICGLFARRAYNLEGILCMPVGSGRQSRIWLLVNRNERFDQMVKQVTKLEDVLEVHLMSAERCVFEKLEAFFQTGLIT